MPNTTPISDIRSAFRVKNAHLGEAKTLQRAAFPQLGGGPKGLEGERDPREEATTAPDGPQGPLDEAERRRLGQLLTEMRPRALAVAMRILRDKDDAEDAVQDALVKVCRHMERFEGRSAFSTWLHRIVVNASLDRLRQRRYFVETSADDGEDGPPRKFEPVDERTPEEALGKHQEEAAVREALTALGDSHREVLMLREYDELSYEEIAHSMGCPLGTVMSRLHHARKRLAVELLASDEETWRQAA